MASAIITGRVCQPQNMRAGRIQVAGDETCIIHFKITSMKKVLLLMNLSFSMIGAGQIWLVTTLVLPPLGPWSAPAQFHDYHIAWWRSIRGPIFIPRRACDPLYYRFAEVSLRFPAGALWMSIVLICLTYGLTFVWWAPLMALIGASPRGMGGRPYAGRPSCGVCVTKHKSNCTICCLETHWLRLALVTIYALVIFLGGPCGNP